jgi:propanediol dehydratase small subunit
MAEVSGEPGSKGKDPSGYFRIIPLHPTLEKSVRLETEGDEGGFEELTMKPKKFDPKRDYPLASRRPDLVKTLTGKSLHDITMEGILSGKIDAQEIRIRPETLELQAQVAEKHGRPQLALNFRRAAELTRIPDEEVLKIYNALRPHRSTKEQLLIMAKELEKKYQAKINAAFIREALKVYEKRGLLR